MFASNIKYIVIVGKECHYILLRELEMNLEAKNYKEFQREVPRNDSNIHIDLKNRTYRMKKLFYNKTDYRMILNNKSDLKQIIDIL